MIVVVDYGMGNIRSVSKAFETIGAEVEVSNDSEELAAADAIVLPGVGAFARGMENLTRLNLTTSINEAAKRKTPILGICLGLQLLFTESEEHGLHRGLNLISGRVKRFPGNVKVPHMGWNQVSFRHDRLEREDAQHTGMECRLFSGVQDSSYFYFVHSYFVEPVDKNLILAATEYGGRFASAVGKGNIFGVQFHPEKSGELGLRILENFVKFS